LNKTNVAKSQYYLIFIDTTTNKEIYTGQPGERPQRVRHDTYTRLEGSHHMEETTSHQEYQQFTNVTRTQAIKQVDNLSTTGVMTFETSSKNDFDEKTPDREKPIRRRTWTKIDGERHFETTSSQEYREMSSKDTRQSIVRREDNLRMEGTFDSRQEIPYVPAERTTPKRPKDNLKPEGMLVVKNSTVTHYQKVL